MFIWLVLIRRKNEIALFENGTFLPRWRIEEFDRFQRHPEIFSAQWYSGGRSQKRLLRDLTEAIPTTEKFTKRDSESLVGFISRLVAWYKGLPRWAMLTREIPEESIALRSAIQSAVDPVDLLTEGLPNAVKPAESGIDDERALLNGFKSAVEGLDAAYLVLANWIADSIRDELNWGATTEDMRTSCRSIPSSVVDRIKDPASKSFLIRGQSDGPEGWGWIEAVSGALASQSPKFWSDQHKEEFSDRLKVVGKELRDAERRSFAADADGSSDWLRVIIESPPTTIADEFVQMEKLDGIDELSHSVEQLFEKSDVILKSDKIALLNSLLVRELRKEG